MMAAVVPSSRHHPRFHLDAYDDDEEEDDMVTQEPPTLAQSSKRTNHHQRQQKQQKQQHNVHNHNDDEDDDEDIATLELILVGHEPTGTRADTVVYIRVADLQAREQEMQLAARQFQIPADRWSGSLLYRHYHDAGAGAAKTLRLDPERDCIERNYSYAMTWEDWLTELLVQYYETGRLNIPDACQGSDLLLLLEYFGILYAPDQLVFASYAAYQRVRAWSDYLTQRSVLADHVVHLLTLVPNRRTARVYQLGTVERPAEKLTLQHHEQHRDSNAPVPIYSWGADVTDIASQSHLQPQSLPTSRVIYNLFNMTKENKVAEALRDDFAVYLQNLVPLEASDVTFSVKMVQVRAGMGAEPYRGKRAILKLVVNPLPQQRGMPSSAAVDRTKSELTYPIDEVPNNRMSPPSVVADKEPRGAGGKPPPRAPTQHDLSAEHVYRDLDDGAAAKPKVVDRKTPPKLSQQRSIDPVMAGKPEAFNAPIDVVDQLDSATITSALTGPFNGGDTAMGDEDVRAEALRQEWVQASLLNRDIDHRMKALLEGELERGVPSPIVEEKEEYATNPTSKAAPGTPETTPSEASENNSPAAGAAIHTEDPPDDKGCTPWEWVNTLCSGFYENKPSPTRQVPAVRQASLSTAKPSQTPPPPATTEPRQAQVVVRTLTPPKETNTTTAAAPPPTTAVPATESDKTHAATTKSPAAEPPAKARISTHEGVKQRLAELRKKHDRDSTNRKEAKELSKKTAASAKKTAASAKKSDAERSVSPSKRAAFFRQVNKVVAPRKSTTTTSTTTSTTKHNSKASKKSCGDSTAATAATKRSVPAQKTTLTGAKKTATTGNKKADGKKTASSSKKTGTGLLKLFRRGNE